MKYDMLSIGNLSLDFNIDYLDHQVVEVGGAVIYSAAAGVAGGYKVGAVTKLNPKDKERLEKFTIPKEDIFYVPSEHSTSIRNKYFTADKERRLCTCLGQAEGFTVKDIPDVESSIYHFAGLIYGDFDGELIKALSFKGKTAVDVQGLLRRRNFETEEMYFEDWADKKTYFPYIYYLKTDTAEAEILTGQTDRFKAAEMFLDWGVKEVVITNSKEVLAANKEELKTVPIRARNLSGRSGRGDTTFGAYVTERQNASLSDALLWATAMVSNKMEKIGPYTGNRETVEAYIKEFYPEYK